MIDLRTHIVRSGGIFVILTLLMACGRSEPPASNTLLPSAHPTNTIIQAALPQRPSTTPSPLPAVTPISVPTPLTTVIPTGTAVLPATDAPTQAVSQGWQNYRNDRYHYAILFPASWPRGAELANGAGMNLYSGDPIIDIHIVAYGSTDTLPPPLVDPTETMVNLHAKIQLVVINNGYIAQLNLKREGHTILYELIRRTERAEIRFYANMPDTFFISMSALCSRPSEA